QAPDFKTLREQLREDDLFLVEYKEVKKKSATKQMKSKALAEFCRELGMMISAGVPLIRALNIMTQRDIPKKQKETYTKLYGSLQRGVMLSEAMEEQEGVFPELLVYMYRASESSGNMDLTCRKMAAHYEQSHKLSQKVKSAAIYPIILMSVTFAVLLVIFLAVLPSFFDLYESLGAELPGITQFMLNLSIFIRDNFLYILIVVLVLIAAIGAMVRAPKIRRKLDRLKLRLPVVGKLMKIIYTARFADTLASSYASGISMINALENTRNTVGNMYIAEQFGQVVTDIRNGEPLSTAVGKVDGFDSKLAASIMIGEETGQLEDMLNSTAGSFNYEAEIALSRLTAILEPLMIVLMAVIIGAVIISVMLPIPGMYNAIGTGA
ncbi:MAG: type II secretion system F family protein, partial [Bacillota bacterium]|nr:type II secretion system F family protein [Bacillota bacterium]